MIDFAAAREAMVDRSIRPSDVTRYPIIAAMLAVPREDFLPDALRQLAYLGEHLPLGGGRVLLDPRSFAKLLEAVAVGPGDLVLDLGCGYGYSAAVIARLGEAVVAVESDADMAREATARLVRAGADNAVVHAGELERGAPELGPFDAVLVEGGIAALPAAIAEQVKPGGRVGAIFVENGHGHARIGVRTGHGLGWRRVFDATAPVLPGFARAKAFEF